LERRERLLARLLGFTLAGMALGCSHQGVRTQRLSDGSFEFRCDEELWVCLSHVKDFCKGGPYEVLGGSDQPKTYGTDDSRVEGHRSHAVVRCLRAGAELVEVSARPVRAPIAVHTPAKSAKPTLAPAPVRACVPGATQPCVGPAACSGGQACLADGSGFGPCDCGRERVEH